MSQECAGNLEYSDCHSSCEPDRFCGGKEPEVCDKLCNQGCGCPQDLIRSFKDSTICIKKEDCQGNMLYIRVVEHNYCYYCTKLCFEDVIAVVIINRCWNKARRRNMWWLFQPILQFYLWEMCSRSRMCSRQRCSFITRPPIIM